MGGVFYTVETHCLTLVVLKVSPTVGALWNSMVNEKIQSVWKDNFKMSYVLWQSTYSFST